MTGQERQCWQSAVPALTALPQMWRSAVAPRCLVFALHAPSLDQPTANRLVALLSPEERLRHERMAVWDKQTEFLVSRALLRRVLGALLDLPPAAIAFDITEDGKPLLSASLAQSLAFNLAHSEGFVLVAVAEAASVGVDVESIAAYKSGIARRFFSATEYGWLEQHPPESRAAAFYQLWTIKEACIKALGTGVRDLRGVSLVPSATAGIWRGLHWQTLYIDRGVQAALARRPATSDDVLQPPHIYRVDLPWLLVGLA